MRADKNSRKAFTSAILFILSLLPALTGCSNQVEVQNRDFVLALGISVKDDKYELTFGLPDLSILAKGGEGEDEQEGNGQVRTYEGFSLTEIEDLYNHGSNKRLDYRHLDALILDEAIGKASDKIQGLFEYMDNHYQISRDVRVFYYSGDVKKLIEEKGKIKGGIGDYLEKLERNHQGENGLEAVTLGNLTDSFYQKKDVLIPIIELKEDKLEINGAAIFQDSVFRKEITDEELKIYHVIKGQGKEYNFRTKNGLVFKLKGFKSKQNYQFYNNKPTVYLSISGTAEKLSAKNDDSDFEREINEYLMNAVSSQINTCFKSERMDYLNLYSGSSLKNRDIWLSYQNRLSDFINDTDIAVNVDIEATSKKVETLTDGCFATLWSRDFARSFVRISLVNRGCLELF